MKRILTTLILIAGLYGTKVQAQETSEAPLDTLTRTVAGMRQELDVLKRLKVSGYIQAQFQYADSAGAAAYLGGAFPAGADKRFSLRRGRVKFQYDAPVNDKGISTSQYVFQFDVSEKGLTIKDLYGKFTDPWSGWLSITAGMQNRPFGFEIGYSSSMRESPERGRLSQIVFPNERDLGAMLTIQGPKSSDWNWVKLEAGFFNGTGGPGQGASLTEFDKMKDFIGHLSINRNSKSEKMKYGFGVSYYNGGYRIDSVSVYNNTTDPNGVPAFVLASKASENWNGGLIGSRNYSNRTYYGVDGQLSIDWAAGMTTLRGEYVSGQQPGTSSSTASATVPVTSNIYNRNFNGAYFYFLQNIMQTPWQVIVKYDWYDPNTDTKGDQIGKTVSTGFTKTNATDIMYTTLGAGIAYRWDAYVKLTAYYDMVTNETSANLSGYTKDLSDNVFTLRMQVKF
jgi:hypothetical protein